MLERTHRTPGLALGLITFGVVSLGALVFLFSVLSRPDSVSPSAPHTQQTAREFPTETASVDPFLSTLAAANPGLTDRLITVAPLLPDETARRTAILETTLTVLKQEAPYLRYASLGAFTDLLIAFDDGMSQLDAAGSEWCEATTLADLTRLNEDELVPHILSVTVANDDAFDWALTVSDIALSAATDARRAPTRHGPRTQRDEAVVQFYGRQLGMERLSVALSVAAFSHAEGRDFATMQQAIAGVDVCELADAFVDLSDRLPNDVKGRVMAELAPEIFYGNTPYVLYLFQGYFFIG